MSSGNNERDRKGPGGTLLLRDVMTVRTRSLSGEDTCEYAATQMRELNVGFIMVCGDSGELIGVVTDRDLVMRTMATGDDPSTATLRSICSRDLVTFSPEQTVATALAAMRRRAVRRVPIVSESGVPVGVVSLGDLAQRLHPKSLLCAISAAAPTR